MSEIGQSEGESRGRRVALWVAGLALLVFLPSLAAGFVYDDVALISENPYAQSLEHLLRGFRTHLFDVYAYGAEGFRLRYYRPIVTASYVLNWVAGSGAAWPFHLVNVAGHAAATYLVVRCAERWTGHRALGVVVGLLFALHPSRTESVIWIAGRTDVFMVVLSLGAVEAAVAAARASTRTARGGLLVAALGCTALSILSKEGGASTALLLLPDVARAAKGSVERRRLLAAFGVLAAVGVAYVALRALVYPVRPHRAAFDPSPRYGLLTCWAYVERIVFPWPQTFFYRPVEAQNEQAVLPVPLLIGGAAVLGAYSAALFRAVARDRVAAALLVAAAVGIGPVLNFSFTNIYVTTSDHFLYLPLALAAAGLLRLGRERALVALQSRAAQLAGIGVLMVYAAVDVVRVVDFGSDEVMLRHELSLEPDNPVALAGLASLVAGEGDLATAAALTERALSPAAQRFMLLRGTSEVRASLEARRLALRAALTADGDAVALERAYAELEALLHHRQDADGNVLDDAAFLRVLPDQPGKAIMAADVALLGTRVGQVARASQLAAAIPDRILERLASPMNFVLTVARLGDFPRARRLIERIRSARFGPATRVEEAALSELRARVDRAQARLTSAMKAPERAARIDAALGMAELGATLRALRVLRPLHDAEPAAEDVGPLYVQLLVAARLPGEALAEATRVLGPDGARETVAAYEAALPPRVRALPAPAEPSSWWRP